VKTSTEIAFIMQGFKVTFTFDLEQVKEYTGLFSLNNVTDALFSTAQTIVGCGYLQRKKFIFQLEKADNGISSIQVEKSVD